MVGCETKPITSSIPLDYGNSDTLRIRTDIKQLFDLKDGPTTSPTGGMDFCMIGGLCLQVSEWCSPKKN